MWLKSTIIMSKHSILISLFVVAIILLVIFGNAFLNPNIPEFTSSTTKPEQSEVVVVPSTNATLRSDAKLAIEEDLNQHSNSVDDEETAEINAHSCDSTVIDKVNSLLANTDLDIPFQETSTNEGTLTLKASYEYLSHLDENSLDQLARQGFRDAMAVRGEQLVNAEDHENREQGREFLYNAGVLGSTYSLTGLVISYYDEYLKALETGTDELAKEAYKNVHNTQYLIDRLAPMPKSEDNDFSNALTNENIANGDGTAKSQQQSLAKFNNARVNEGLPIIGDEDIDFTLAQTREVSKALEECLNSELNYPE